LLNSFGHSSLLPPKHSFGCNALSLFFKFKSSFPLKTQTKALQLSQLTSIPFYPNGPIALSLHSKLKCAIIL
jgi:hypothetical protein